MKTQKEKRMPIRETLQNGEAHICDDDCFCVRTSQRSASSYTLALSTPLLPKACDISSSESEGSCIPSYTTLGTSDNKTSESVTTSIDSVDERSGNEEERKNVQRGSCSYCWFDGGPCGALTTNEGLLSVAFVSFLGFTVAQFFAAIYARSTAMMADTAAMLVDAATYALNLYAERAKKSGRSKRTILQLELIPPLVSLSTLLLVNALVTRDAIETLVGLVPSTEQDESQVDPVQQQPNVAIMLAFSALNLAVDVFNVTCFARAKKLLGFSPSSETERRAIILTESEGEEDTSNLNMCSAYSHVWADTLRSITVLIVATVAALEGPQRVDPERADAVAALVVSFLIAVGVIPLVRGLMSTWAKLRLELQADMMQSEEKRHPKDISNQDLLTEDESLDSSNSVLQPLLDYA